MRIAFYVGPTAVNQIAEKLREAGVTVTCEGTERVYVEAPVPPAARGSAVSDERLAREGVLFKLRAKHGTTFGLDTPIGLLRLE